MESTNRPADLGVAVRRINRAGASVTLAFLLLAGCSGDEEPGAGGSESAANGGASATATLEPSEDTTTSGTSGAASGFCADIEAAEKTLTDVPDKTDFTDPAAALQALQQSLDAVRNVDPPAEIADDWSTIVSYLESVSKGLSSLDVTDPQKFTQQLDDLGQTLDEKSQAFDDATTRVDAYLEDTCGAALP